MSEGFPKPTSEERERARRAHAEADPTTFSELPVRDGNEAPDVLEKEGQAFYQLKENPELQQLASRLLKGIINVADVIEGPGEKLYSKEMPLDSIRGDLTRDDIVADLELISLVLDDGDHHIESDWLGSKLEHSENNISMDGRTATYYDFDQAKLDSPRIVGLRHVLSRRTLARLASKLEELESHYGGGDGEALMSAIYTAYRHAVNPAGEVLDPAVTQDFYYRVMGRIRNARERVANELRELDAKGK